MIEEYRKKIDSIDDQIAALLNERLNVARKIGEEKQKNNSGVLDRNREKDIINRVTQLVNPEYKLYVKMIYETMFETSKAYQRQFVSKESEASKAICTALDRGIKKFPVSANVACQGVAGAYADIAANKMFEISNNMYFKNWDAVFEAVDKGLCDYGVLPIENSSVGSVNRVYDLMRDHKFYIVRALKLRVQHNLLTKPGVKLESIKEIISHQQAIDQCSEFIAKLKDVKVTVCDNTAQAAKMIAESGRKDFACISSRECAEIYGLSICESNIQNNDNNYTRFICISKNLEIFEKSNKISIMVNLPHEKGSLNKILNKFSTLGLNLTKLESRPMQNTNFEFTFYFDFDGSVEDEEVVKLIADLDYGTERFTFLGSYTEV